MMMCTVHATTTVWLTSSRWQTLLESLPYLSLAAGKFYGDSTKELLVPLLILSAVHSMLVWAGLLSHLPHCVHLGLHSVWSHCDPANVAAAPQCV